MSEAKTTKSIIRDGGNPAISHIATDFGRLLAEIDANRFSIERAGDGTAAFVVEIGTITVEGKELDGATFTARASDAGDVGGAIGRAFIAAARHKFRRD